MSNGLATERPTRQNTLLKWLRKKASEQSLALNLSSAMSTTMKEYLTVAGLAGLYLSHIIFSSTSLETGNRLDKPQRFG